MAEEPAVDEVLDLTNEHLRTLEGVEIKPGLTVRRREVGKSLLSTSPSPPLGETDSGPRRRRRSLRSIAALLSLSHPTSPPSLFQTPRQAVDLTTNRLREIDPRVLALTGGSWFPGEIAATPPPAPPAPPRPIGRGGRRRPPPHPLRPHSKKKPMKKTP